MRRRNAGTEVQATKDTHRSARSGAAKSDRRRATTPGLRKDNPLHGGFFLGLRDGYGRLTPPADQFDHHRTREDEGLIFAFIDFNPAGGGEGEPAPRADCHGLIRAREDVLVIQKVAVGFETVGPAHADREPMAEAGEKLAHDYRE